MDVQAPRLFIDQLGRKVRLPAGPLRIISTVPSQTELLADLGLDAEVIGITKFCVHPKSWFHSKIRIGGTKKLDIEKIAVLNPELIIANKEENLPEQIMRLAERFPVWISDVQTLNDALQMIIKVGELVNRKSAAVQIAEPIRREFSALGKELKDQRSRTCAYLIWNEPLMTVGGDTFIHHMLEAAGFENVFSETKRYPEISVQELRQRQPELILLSSEPFPFRESHADSLHAVVPKSKVLFVDGEMFSWYGSRLLQAPAYFRKLNQ